MWFRRLIVSFYPAGSDSRELFSFLSLTRADKHGRFRMYASGFCGSIAGRQAYLQSVAALQLRALLTQAGCQG
jgi:hypothetical protein